MKLEVLQVMDKRMTGCLRNDYLKEEGKCSSLAHSLPRNKLIYLWIK